MTKTEEKTKNFVGMRIAKWLARAGVASRREAERLVEAKRVSVDGKTIDSPALNVTDKNIILLDGESIKPPEETRLWRFHKKIGTLTTNKDPQGRPTIFEDIPGGMPRLITVGRLDFNTEGLLLLTNDGSLARHLELPDNAWKRNYRVRVHGFVDKKKLKRLEKGVRIDGVQYDSIKATLEDTQSEGMNKWLTVTITEGKNREVRKVMEFVGLQVTRLIRVSFGPFQLGNLARTDIQEVPQKVLKDSMGKFFKK